MDKELTANVLGLYEPFLLALATAFQQPVFGFTDKKQQTGITLVTFLLEDVTIA